MVASITLPVHISTSHIQPKHWQEWTQESAIHPDITALNLFSLEGDSSFDYLLYGLDVSQRRNDGRLRDKWLNQYAHLAHGGWWCSGLNLLSDNPSTWGCFKPDRPREIRKDHKTRVIKYEHPPKVPTEIFALRVSLPLWQAIADRHPSELPDTVDIAETGEAIAFWQWVIDHPEVPLIITEGAKKAAALLSIGYPAIALPGIYNGYRQPRNDAGEKLGRPKLIDHLNLFAQPNREIIFAFDQDSKPKTIANVRQAIATTGKLFTLMDCRVAVMSWVPDCKGTDDLIVSRGPEAFHLHFDERKPFDAWLLQRDIDLTPLVDQHLNQRYLADLTPPTDAQIIAIRSAKGTGKTEWLSQQLKEHQANGRRTLVLTHRIQLAKALAERLGIDHIEEVRNSDTKGVLGYSLCVDSLHAKSQAHFNPKDWEGTNIILDEAEQVFWHLLNSRTCQDHRVPILKSLKETVRLAIEGGGRIYLCDADLSPIAIEYIQQLLGFSVPTWVAHNHSLPNQDRDCFWYDGNNPSSLVSALELAIANGDKVLIHTSSQKTRSRWGSKNLESFLQDKFPELKILRIDSESIAEPGHPAFGCMAHLNEILPHHDIAIASPSIETGVSIDIKDHFDSVWAIALGVQTVDGVAQALERLRDDVPRHVWASLRGLQKVGNGSSNYGYLLQSQQKLTKANIQQLMAAGLEEDFDVDFQQESLKTWARRACLVNLGMAQYREHLQRKLVSEGYQLINLGDTGDSEPILHALDNQRDINYLVECMAITESEEIEDNQLKKLQDKRTKTPQERHQERKAILSRRYKIPITPDVVEKDDQGWYRQLRNHYYLTLGQDFLPQRDQRSVDSLLIEGEGSVFAPDLNRSCLAAKIQALQLLDIEQFLDPECVFSSDSLKDWHRKLLGWRYEIKTILGITIKPDQPAIATAKRLLKDLLGLKLTHLGRRGGRGQQLHVYGACNINPDGRLEVFDQWLARDLEQATKTEAQTNEGNITECNAVVTTPYSKDLSKSGDDYEVNGGGENALSADTPAVIAPTLLAQTEEVKRWLEMGLREGGGLLEDLVTVVQSFMQLVPAAKSWLLATLEPEIMSQLQRRLPQLHLFLSDC